MENLSSNFSEDFGYSEQLVNTDTAVDNFFVEAPGPGGDEDEEEDGKEEAEQGNEDGDPPLDEEVVHSPVTTQTGGMPKAAPTQE